MKTISNVQVLRGLAATSVMMAHAVGMLTYNDIPVSLPNVDWGAFGVDVFFVISGFVIAYSSVPAFGHRGAVLPFLWKRVVRVVPLYWMASIAFALVSTSIHAPARELRQEMWATIRAMLFIPGADGSTSVMPTGWTLFFEMAFYGSFACALPFRRCPALVVLGSVLAGLSAAEAAGLLPTRLASVTTPQVLEFVAGLAIAEAYGAGWRVPRQIAMGLACLVFLGLVVEFPKIDALVDWRFLVWGVPAALIVGVLALSREVSRRSRVRVGLERLGDASYSIYLVHFPLFWAMGDAFTGFARKGPHAAALYALISMVAGLAVSFAVHRFVEVPTTRWLQQVGRGDLEGVAARSPAPSRPDPCPAADDVHDGRGSLESGGGERSSARSGARRPPCCATRRSVG